MAIKKHSKTAFVLEEAIVTITPDYFRPKVLPEDPVGGTIGKAERPEHSVVVYKAGQVLKQFFDVSKSPCWTVHGAVGCRVSVSQTKRKDATKAK